MDKLPSIIVSVFDGNFKGLNEIIQNKEMDHFIREEVLETYIYFYDNNLISKNDLIKFLRDLTGLYEYDDEIYNAILEVIIKTHLIEMTQDVKKMFDECAIDEYIRGGYAEFIDYLFDYDSSAGVELITSVEDSMAWWYCFKGDKDDDDRFNADKMSQALNEFMEIDKKQHIANNKKVGRNDPCPCGSGKKFKKCCLDKMESGLPYQNYIEESLKKYPKKNSNKDELDFYSIYEERYIEIDKLLYKVMKNKRVPIFIKRNLWKENEMYYSYLDEAYPLIKEIIEKEKFKTIEEYDKKVSIHYSLYSFFSNYTGLMVEKIKHGKKQYIENLEEVIRYFYNTFEIDTEYEYIFLDKIDDYFIFTKQYEEAIKFFQGKLGNNSNKMCNYDYLFHLYSIMYDYDECVKKMDDAINNETDEDLKEELQFMKLEYVDEEDYEDYEF